MRTFSGVPSTASPPPETAFTYKSSDAASADGGLEVALQLLLDGAGGVEALGQEEDGVDEEEGRDAVDDVLKDLDPGRGKRERQPIRRRTTILK